MDISAQHHYTATPAQVYEMFNDPRWWQKVAAQAGVHHVEIEQNDGHAILRARVPMPASIQSIAGNALAVTAQFDWQPGVDGWDGTFSMTTPGKVPATAEGRAAISKDSSANFGTLVNYDGQFTVSIPLFGKRIETTAAPYVTKIIDAQQTAGNDWLAAMKY